MELRTDLPFNVKPYVFNLWLATKNVKAPNIANELIKECEPFNLNWVLIGCVGAVNSKWFSRPTEGLFGVQTDILEPVKQLPIAVPLISEYETLADLDNNSSLNFTGITEAVYKQFIKWAEAFGGVSDLPEPEEPTPEPEEPTPEPEEPVDEKPKEDKSGLINALLDIIIFVWDLAKNFIPIPSGIIKIVSLILKALEKLTDKKG